MAKDPAFLFYTGDFLSGTKFLTDEQLGVYLRLLMAQHQHGHLTEKQVKIICKSYDNEVIEKFKKDEQGLYYNERLDIEILKRKLYTQSRSTNRTGKTKESKPKKKIISKSYDKHMENKDEDINKEKKEDNIEKTPLEKKFDEYLNFRKAKKVPVLSESLQALKNKLWKLSGQDTETAIKILDESISNGWTGLFELKEKNKINGKSKTIFEQLSESYGK